MMGILPIHTKYWIKQTLQSINCRAVFLVGDIGNLIPLTAVDFPQTTGLWGKDTINF
jgi:hypothetical protein